MIIFIKKLKSKEGINSFDIEKVKKDIPQGYKALGQEPMVTLTANHVVVAYKCEKMAKVVKEVKDTPKPAAKAPKAKSKKVEAPVAAAKK